ncbi:MAG: mshD [Acidimicrobiaceae bacterium]|nr:mshD [Acidimicrobiaceae bacterium]
MVEVEVKRRMGEDDIAEVAALLRAVQAADGHAGLGEHQWLDLVQGGRSGSAGFVARTPGRARLAGYAQLSRGPDSWAVEVAVDPAQRQAGIGIDLLRAALAEVAAQGGGHVHLWVPKPTELHDQVASAVGLERGRELIQMRRSLPLDPMLAEAADGFPVRSFRVGKDEPAWLELNNLAFGGHPEQGAWDLGIIEERERQPWFDPEGFLLHERNGRLAAFCWTKIADRDDPSDPGEIYVIGVRPGLQGVGLGRAMLAAGAAYLSSQGKQSIMLYVDAGNTGAVHLYRSFGFAVDHHDRAYVGNVPAAPHASERGTDGAHPIDGAEAHGQAALGGGDPGGPSHRRHRS